MRETKRGLSEKKVQEKEIEIELNIHLLNWKKFIFAVSFKNTPVLMFVLYEYKFQEQITFIRTKITLVYKAIEASTKIPVFT